MATLTLGSDNKHQAHIDGLRAIAVLSVILFHYDINGFRGGYVGVDIFFVISGFLITRMIAEEIIETGGFDFRAFYIRRTRRLLPALFCTLAISFIVAAWLLSPVAFHSFGRSVTATIFSASNILFWNESGYFDTASELKPLLHTWSLSVEEQFYLVWPVIIYAALWNGNRGWLLATIGALGLISFILNYIWVNGNFDDRFQASIFYVPFFRVFEFSIGALGIFLVRPLRNMHALRVAAAILGLGLIAYSVTSFSESIIFPYRNALVPSVGALCIILAGNTRLTNLLVANRAFVFVGLISYSLYLVHWPILSFYKYSALKDPAWIETLVLVAATFVAAYFMYQHVETPVRRVSISRKEVRTHYKFILASLVSVFGLGALGSSLALSDGWSWRQPKALTASAVRKGKERRYSLSNKGCDVDRLSNPQFCDVTRPVQVLVIGDSHEVDGYNAFRTIYGADPHVNLILFGNIGRCNIGFQDGRPSSSVAWDNCRERVAKLGDPKFLSGLNVVIYSASRPFALEKEVYWKLLESMSQANRKASLVVLGGYIATRIDCSELFNYGYTFDTCKDRRFVSFVARGEREGTKIDIVKQLGYTYIDKFNLLCSQGKLELCKVEARGEPMFYDKHHLSLGFAAMLGRLIARSYGEKLRKIGLPAVNSNIFDSEIGAGEIAEFSAP